MAWERILKCREFVQETEEPLSRNVDGWPRDRRKYNGGVLGSH
jgi:hypothetical protein